MAILVTGGAGYIGSHTCLQLLEAGYDVVVADNLSNSKMQAINRVEHITGKNIHFYLTDTCDREAVHKIFQNETIDGVIHFAAYKAVGESVEKPLEYYKNNLLSAIIILEEMQKAKVKNLVFSSCHCLWKSSNHSYS